MTDFKIRVSDTGITCLHPGGDNPKADLVFVHGLGGHPQLTWSTEPRESKASAEPGVPIAKRVLNQFSSFPQRGIIPAWSRKRKRSTDDSSAAEEQPQAAGDVVGSDKSVHVALDTLTSGKVFWPRDLLPRDVEDVRVLTFGYYSNPAGSSQDNLYTLSNNLLRKVANERLNATRRPIIFIAHSLGGILTKFCLKISESSTGANARLRAVRDSTKGIIFFGTPHSGSHLASWGEMLRRISGIFAVTNSTLLAALDPKSDNGQLEEISEAFDKMLGPGSDRTFQVFSFRESQPVLNGPFGPMTDLVVPYNSSLIASQWAASLTVVADHLNICKFRGSGDPAYKDFVRELQEGFLNKLDAEDKLEPHVGGGERLSKEKREWLRALYTCPYKERMNVNPQRVKGTCEWFTSHQHFRNWEESSATSLLWVTADPGCGKSVLARYLVDEKLQDRRTRTICYFFFKDGVQDQESSIDAMRCILRQLLLQSPTAFSHQVLAKLEQDGGFQHETKEPPARGPDLWDLFMTAVTAHGRGEIVCVLDGLDECKVPDRNYLIDCIVGLNRKRTVHKPVVKFLLTSRPYSEISERFQDLEGEDPTIRVSGENHEQARRISREIDLVIKNRIDRMHQRLGKKEQEVLLEKLTEVDNRTYLWVHLIFDEIEKNGVLLSQARIQSFVDKIPRTVDEAYDKMLSKSRDKCLARKILHIVLAAVRPLTLEEMALALAIKPVHRSWDDLEPELFPIEQFRREVKEACGFFVVVSDTGTIHLFHQTSREFLVPSLSSGPLGKQVWKASFLPAESNRILAEICLWRLSLSDFNRQEFYANGGKEQYITARPFLSYAVEFWAYHLRDSDFGASDAIMNSAFSLLNLQSPASMKWIDLFRVLTGRRGSFIPLVVASEFGLPAVVQRLLEAGADVSEEDTNGFTPLLAASTHGSDAVVTLLIKAGANVNDKSSYWGGTPLHCASENGFDMVVQRLLAAGADYTARDYNGTTPLHCASDNGFDMAVQRLLEAGSDPNAQDGSGITSLYCASSNGFAAIVRQLLRKGAVLNIGDGGGWTPLLMASEAGYDAVVQLILQNGADVNEAQNIGRTALHLASSHGCRKVVQSLLEAGALFDAEDDYGLIPLHRACKYGHDSIVQLLLNVGSDVDKEDRVEGDTPLSIASERGHEGVVLLLLEAGADVNKNTRRRETPLLSASRGGHAGIVRLLLNAGAHADSKENMGGMPIQHG